MRIAGEVVEFFEFSENGEVDVRAEGTFQIGKRCDFVVEQQLSQGIRREGERSHNVIVATDLNSLIGTITNLPRLRGHDYLARRSPYLLLQRAIKPFRKTQSESWIMTDKRSIVSCYCCGGP